MITLVFLLIGATADCIVAKVGSKIILQNELEGMALYLSLQTGLSSTELKEKILLQTIENQLFLYQAEKDSLTVEKEEIDKLLEEKVDNLSKRYPSYQDFQQDLKKNDLTIDKLKEDFRKEATEYLLVQKLIAKRITPTISISPTELKRFYEENKDSIAIRPTTVKVKHILLVIKPSEETIKEAFQRVYEVKKLLDTGGDFATLAKEFSEDENSRRRGGMLGKIKRGETHEEFEKAVWSMKPGDISQPFQTRLGFHIVEVLSRDKESMLLRQILIKVKTIRQDTLRTKELADRIVGQARDDSTFDRLAQKYSIDPQIDLGEYAQDQISPPFNEIVKDLPVRTPSEPFLTPIGYHILYVVERNESKMLSFEEIKDQLAEYLFQTKLKEKYNQMVNNLKKEVFVQILE